MKEKTKQKNEVICDGCGANLGVGDPYDLMKNHLWSCTGEKAKKVRKAIEEEDSFNGRYTDY